jgi:hypothetical protein
VENQLTALGKGSRSAERFRFAILLSV